MRFLNINNFYKIAVLYIRFLKKKTIISDSLKIGLFTSFTVNTLVNNLGNLSHFVCRNNKLINIIEN